MRKIHFLPVMALVILTSCKTLPRLHPLTYQEKSEIPVRCQSLFVTDQMQLTHSIEANLPAGGTSLLMGILVIYPDLDQFESVIMTIEGLVIFSAQYKQGNITVRKAVSHFKSALFATGLVNDIKLIFFKPGNGSAEFGKSGTGFPICRYPERDGDLIELTLNDSYWEIRQYDADRLLRRTVQVFSDSGNRLSVNDPAIPLKIRLTAHGRYGYSLTLRLIEATAIEE